jgi:hypothetical protein
LKVRKVLQRDTAKRTAPSANRVQAEIAALNAIYPCVVVNLTVITIQRKPFVMITSLLISFMSRIEKSPEFKDQYIGRNCRE